MKNGLSNLQKCRANFTSTSRWGIFYKNHDTKLPNICWVFFFSRHILWKNFDYYIQWQYSLHNKCLEWQPVAFIFFWGGGVRTKSALPPGSIMQGQQSVFQNRGGVIKKGTFWKKKGASTKGNNNNAFVYTLTCRHDRYYKTRDDINICFFFYMVQYKKLT